MAPISYVQIKDASGARKAVFTATARDGGDNGFLYVAWRKRVNGVYMAEMTINADNPDAIYLQDKYQLEIWRADYANGLSDYLSFDGTIRDDQPFTDEDNRRRLTIRAYGHNERLARRRIAYPANTLDFTLFTATKGETVLKRLVRYNCDPVFATVANARDRQPSTLNLTTATDLARGNTIDWTCGGRNNLLDELQKIALIAGGDFAVTKTGAASYVFEFYPNQLGTDRSSGANPVIFSTDRGNMATPKLVRTRSSEKTIMIVGGRGENDTRTIRVRSGVNFSAANDIEDYIDGRNSTTTAALDDIGDQALEEKRFRNVIEYEVLQKPLYTVEKDYFLGDRVLAIYAGLTVTQQVYEIAFEYSDTEAVSITMRDL
jgi:ReqiPepy6 Gp37-like protein